MIWTYLIREYRFNGPLLGTMELRLAIVCKDSGKNSGFDMLYLGVII